MNAFIVILIVMFILLMIVPCYWTYKVDGERFRKIGVGKLAFMFCGIGNYTEVKKEGVMLPMFVLRVMDFAFAFLYAVMAVVLPLAAGLGVMDVAFIVMYMAVADVALNVVVCLICMLVSKKSKQ